MSVTHETKDELRACEMRGQAPAVCPACGATESDACMIDNPRVQAVDEIKRLRDALAAAEAERDRLRQALRGMIDTCGQHVEDVLSSGDCPDEFAAIDAARAALGDAP